MKFLVILKKTEQFMVRADDGDAAVQEVVKGFARTKPTASVIEVSAKSVREDLRCGVDEDGVACGEPAECYSVETDQFVCAKHRDALAGKVPDEAQEAL